MIYERIEDCPQESYDIIMADPAWRFKAWSKRGLKKSADAHYRTMTIEEIRRLPVLRLASANSVLWLWATNPMIDQQIATGREWGFKFSTSGQWVKTTRDPEELPDGRLAFKTAFGPGHVLRSASEPFLIFTRGKPRFSRSTRTVFCAAKREHSRKPDLAYTIARQLVPDAQRCLDLFSREVRDGWDQCGDEVGKFTT